MVSAEIAGGQTRTEEGEREHDVKGGKREAGKGREGKEENPQGGSRKVGKEQEEDS